MDEFRSEDTERILGFLAATAYAIFADHRDRRWDQLIHIVSTFYEIAVDASASTPRDNKIPLSWLNRLNRLLRETHIKLVDRPTMSLTIRPNPVLVGPGYGVEYIKQGHVAQSNRKRLWGRGRALGHAAQPRAECIVSEPESGGSARHFR